MTTSMMMARSARALTGIGRASAGLALLLLGATCVGCGGQNAQNTGPVAISPAEPSPASGELHALAQTLDALLADPARAPQPGPLQERLQQARKDVAWLERRAASWHPGPTVNVFTAAIAGHRQLLELAREKPAAEAASMLDAVARDLAIKARQCRTFGGPVPVDVRVITRDTDNREVSGYEVWYVRKAYEHDPDAFRRFEQYSSPAGHVFEEAGYYVLWADHLTARTQHWEGRPLDIEVGPDRRQQIIDLIVPSAGGDVRTGTP